jgi:peptidoglycan/xylan/chitin deacetylase (PgdA/CDA1 family)
VGRTERIASKAVRRSGAATLIRRLVAKRRVSVLMYHDPDRQTMREHLDYLVSRYSGVTLSSVVGAMRNDRWDTLPDFPLVITFDDGWKDNVRIIDLCRRSGFPVTIFACSAIVGTHRHYWWTETPEPEALKRLPTSRRLTALSAGGFELEREYPDRQAIDRSDLQLMEDVVEVGAHTRFHPILTVCSDTEAWDEIDRSRSEVEAFSGRPCRHFSYPNGNYTKREIEMVARAGFSSARTLDVGWNSVSTDPYRLRQLGTTDDASVDRLAADLSGAAFLWNWRETGRWNGRHSPKPPR